MASQKLVSGDEVIVVADGQSDSARALCDHRWPMPVRFLVHGPTRNFGNAQRNFACRVAHGDWISFMDDDDIYAEEAFVKIRKAAAATRMTQQRPAFVFKTIAPWGEVVWTDLGKIEQGNCCTIQMVVPNARGMLPEWGPRQGANVPYLIALHNQRAVFWRPEIISIARPKQEDIWWHSA